MVDLEQMVDLERRLQQVRVLNKQHHHRRRLGQAPPRLLRSGAALRAPAHRVHGPLVKLDAACVLVHDAFQAPAQKLLAAALADGVLAGLGAAKGRAASRVRKTAGGAGAGVVGGCQGPRLVAAGEAPGTHPSHSSPCARTPGVLPITHVIPSVQAGRAKDQVLSSFTPGRVSLVMVGWATGQELVGAGLHTGPPTHTATQCIQTRAIQWRPQIRLGPKFDWAPRGCFTCSARYHSLNNT